MPRAPDKPGEPGARERLEEPEAPSNASIDDLDEAIRHLAWHLNAVSYRMLLLVREFDDRLGWAKWSFPSCAEWLHWRIGISLSAAREKVRVARALRDLPAISAAFAQGRVSYSKVRALTRAADATNEDALLRFALQAPAAQVEGRCRQIRNVHPESIVEARQAWERRALRVFRDPARHTMTISVEVPLEEGEVVVRALEKAVRLGGSAAGPELASERWHARQADALVAMAKSHLAGGARGARGGCNGATADAEAEAEADADAEQRPTGTASVSADHYQVVVHVDEAALRGGAGRSDLPIETVKRLACDCSVTVVTEDSRGRPLDVGRKRRIVPLPLRRALWARDGGCTFPGCQNTLFVEGHHLEHWARGGETSEKNTALLCSRHHGLVHEGGFAMRRLEDGSFEFRRPDGRVIPRCGYRAEDAAPDPAVLEDFECPSAEAWLAALLARSDRRWRGHRGVGPASARQYFGPAS